MAVPGPARVDGRAVDQRHADPLVPRQFAARARSGEAFVALAARGGGLAAGRQRAGRAALFLRRADADPRSPGQGRDLRAQPDPRRAATSIARCSKASPAAPTTSSRPIATSARRRKDVSRSAAAPRTASGRRRRRTFPAGRRSCGKRRSGRRYGDAFLAALAVGDASAGDIETVEPGRRPPSRRTRRPRDRYAKLYRIFRDLYPATRTSMAALGDAAS